MTVPHCPTCQDEILAHFREGKPLSSRAREHYLECLDCITAVTLELSKNGADTNPTRGAAGMTTVLPESTSRALEHGRQVLKREFGINFASKSGQSVESH